MEYTINEYEQATSQITGNIEKVMRRILFLVTFGKKGQSSKQEQIGADIKNTNDRASFYLDKYGESMLRLAYSYLHNYQDSEEVLQDAIMKMLGVNTEFETMAHEKSYLMKVVSNLSKNKIKYNKVREADELMDELVASEKEDLSYVWSAVKKLPEKYREVIHLFYYEGYQTKEIAEILGANESTVRSDISRARKELKNVLKEDYDFE